MFALFVALASAAPSSEMVQEQFPREFVGMDTDFLYREFQRFFEPETLAPQERLDEDTWHCGTGLAMAIRANWDEFGADRRAHMTKYLAPWKQDLTDEVLQNPLPPPMAAPTETCFDAYPSRRPQWAGAGANRIVTEHFSVEWDGNAISQSKAQSWADALELAWEVQFEEMGWKKPGLHSQYLTLAYVADFNYSGAVTSVENCGSGLVPFIIAGKGGFAQGTWYQDMGGHELNHASQFSYGFGHEFYFWESTATWIQEYIFPGHNEWAQYITGYSNSPHLALNKSSQEDQEIFLHMYGMAIFNFYLDQYVGGPEFIEEIWRYAVNNGNQYDLWIGDILNDKGYDWTEIYEDFIATNSVMDYQERNYFKDVSKVDTVNEFPASGGNSSATKPEGYGQNYVRIRTKNASADTPDLSMEFEGAENVDWSVQLVGEVDGAIAKTVKVDVSDGAGEALFYGIDEMERVWLVVSPLTTKAKAYNYTWSVDVLDAGPDPEDSGDTGSGDGGEAIGGCACSSQSSLPGGWWSFAGLVAIGLLRRRSR